MLAFLVGVTILILEIWNLSFVSIPGAIVYKRRDVQHSKDSMIYTAFGAGMENGKKQVA